MKKQEWLSLNFFLFFIFGKAPEHLRAIYIRNDSLHRWLTWLNDSSPPELVEEVMNMDMTILTANERQALLTATDEETQEYLRRREKYELDQMSMINSATRRGEERGEKRGEKKGRINEKLEIARNLLAKGSTPEFVRDITGLDMETIKGLK